LKVLQEKLANEKEFQTAIQIENKNLQRQMSENTLQLLQEINDFNKNIIENTNVSLKNLLIVQKSLPSFEVLGSEINKFLEGIKNFFQ